MAELRRVEEKLLEAMRTLPRSTGQLAEGVEVFHRGARQLEATLQAFREQWPVLMQGFVTANVAVAEPAQRHAGTTLVQSECKPGHRRRVWSRACAGSVQGECKGRAWAMPTRRLLWVLARLRRTWRELLGRQGLAGPGLLEGP